MLKADTSELDEVIKLLDRRAERMVPEAVDEGTAWAVGNPGERHVRRLRPRRRSDGRVVTRVATASGSDKAHSVEHVMYHRLLDFWGDW
jgi:hypothetical protein